MKDKSLSRRDFLKSATTGLAGVSILGPAASSLNRLAPDQQDSERKIIYRALGRTGMELPIVSMGVMNAHNDALVRAALDAGIRHLDTAHYYQRGRNEQMIGRVVKNRPRESFTVATKIPGDHADTHKETIAGFRERMDLSLQRLGLDYVDILYLHGPDEPEDAVDPLFLDILSELKKEGKTRFIGVSTHENEPDIIRAVIESKVYDVVLTAYNFKQDHYQEVRKAISEASAAGVGVIAMKTMVSGYLDEEETIPVNAKAALKWVLQDPNVHTTIPGFTTFDQMETNLSVMADLALTETEEQDLQLQGSLPGLYCQACRVCLPQCSQQLPIPGIMRAHMYARGYRNLGAAQDLLTSLNLPEEVCNSCNCTVRCAKNFPVAKRIKDVMRLRDVPSSFFV
jgi:predicted aldo/keto reductase-like oxidoreductase